MISNVNREHYIIFILLIGIYIAPIIYMSNKKRPKNNMEEQNELSKLWLTVVAPVSLTTILGSEIIFHISENLSPVCRFFSLIAIVLISFSIFCWGTALWINTKNSKIKKGTESAAENAVFSRKSKYNTVGIAMFFAAIGLLLINLIIYLLS